MNTNRLIKTFKKLVSIDSLSFNERELCDFISSYLISLGFEIYEDSVGDKIGGNCGNLYCYLKGDNIYEPILFSAHIDTVKPGKGKKAIIHENKITSDGNTVLGADDISGIVAIIEAITTIKEKNIKHRTIELLFTVAEEVYCLGSRYFDYSIIKSKKAYILDLTGPTGTVACQSPTIISFTIKITGKAAHTSSCMLNTVHSISIISKAISKINVGAIDKETMLNIGTINGGISSNIIPENTTITGEIRSFKHTKAINQLNKTFKIFSKIAKENNAKIETKSQIEIESYKIPPNSEVLKDFKRACNAMNIQFNAGISFGGSDNNNFKKHGIDGIVLSCAMENTHSLDEYASIDELKKITQLLIELMTIQ
ncbi:MAG: M20/M25/M40 family metallo-hydrolase [Methanobrevibacter sp.]|jgi:tripeptide aminopeptidase|nr:M20/M25/M40 family metallo-hydrolase [Candidatus Methanoflexus mossambicus]